MLESGRFKNSFSKYSKSFNTSNTFRYYKNFGKYKISRNSEILKFWQILIILKFRKQKKLLKILVCNIWKKLNIVIKNSKLKLDT